MIKYKDLIITSRFGDPENTVNGFHRGIDFRPPPSDSVTAGFTAVIKQMASGIREGNYIQLFTRFYNTNFYINIFHLAGYEKNRAVNDFVREYDIIGLAGNTGNSFGKHIHYEIFTYNLETELKSKINHYVSTEKIKRVFFDAIELYDYLKKQGEL